MLLVLRALALYSTKFLTLKSINLIPIPQFVEKSVLCDVYKRGHKFETCFKKLVEKINERIHIICQEKKWLNTKSKMGGRTWVQGRVGQREIEL